MNCQTVQERLLERATDSFTELQPHFSTCPECSELADSILDAQFELRQHVEDFVATTTLDASWERALEQADPPARWSRFGLHALGLAAVTAAVLGLAVLGMGPTEPGDPGSEEARALSTGVAPLLIKEAQERMQDFTAIETTTFDVEGLSRQDEDLLHRSTLEAKVNALKAATDAYQALVDSDDLDLQLEGLIGQAQLYEAMGDTLSTFAMPSYLDEKQREVYAKALEAKASGQKEKAADAYRTAATIATDPNRAAELNGHAARISGEIADRHRDAEISGQKIKQEGIELEPTLVKALEVLGQSVQTCDELDPADVKEVQTVLDQGAILLDNQAYEMVPDVLKLVREYQGMVDEVCD